MKIESTENRISGSWNFSDGKMVEDENCKRIKFLTREVLNEIAKDESGWQTLYLNKEDNSYWELSYPQSEMHGGGPPELCRVMNNNELNERYNLQLKSE